MRIWLHHNPSGSGELRINKVDYSKGHQLLNRISNFRAGHQHHVLRDHYKECKIANIVLLGDHITEDDYVRLVLFSTDYASYKPYLDILQKHCDFTVEES